jgi:hypothetical protein
MNVNLKNIEKKAAAKAIHKTCQEIENEFGFQLVKGDKYPPTKRRKIVIKLLKDKLEKKNEDMLYEIHEEIDVLEETINILYNKRNLKKVTISPNIDVLLVEAPLFLRTSNIPMNKMGYFLEKHDVQKTQNGIVIQSKFLVFKTEYLINKKIDKKSETEMGAGRRAAQKFWDKWTKIYTAKYPPEKQLPFYLKKLSQDYKKSFTAIPSIHRKTSKFYAIWVTEKQYSKEAIFLSERVTKNFKIRIDLP